MGPSRPLWPIGPSMPGSPRNRNGRIRVRSLCHSRGLHRQRLAGGTPAWSLCAGPLHLPSPLWPRLNSETVVREDYVSPLLQTCKWLLISLGENAEVLTGASKAPCARPYSPTTLPLDLPPPSWDPAEASSSSSSSLLPDQASLCPGAEAAPSAWEVSPRSHAGLPHPLQVFAHMVLSQ